MVKRTPQQILQEIEQFAPLHGDWRPLDILLSELWDNDLSSLWLATLFGVFERYPKDDGAGVLWSIIHGIESANLNYETELRSSILRVPSEMAKIMLMRLEKSKITFLS